MYFCGKNKTKYYETIIYIFCSDSRYVYDIT